MKKINNKGFALIEILIATVFVAVVFTFVYINVLPTLGDYEKEEMYDPIEMEYVGNLIEELLNDFTDDQVSNIKNSFSNFQRIKLETMGNNPIDLSKTVGYQTTSSDHYNIYITTFTLNKTPILNDARSTGTNGGKTEGVTNEFADYIDYLPTFNTQYHQQTENGYTYQYRLLFTIKDAYGQEHFGNYKLKLDSRWS